MAAHSAADAPRAPVPNFDVIELPDRWSDIA
jgi:hypothetical protein